MWTVESSLPFPTPTHGRLHKGCKMSVHSKTTIFRVEMFPDVTLSGNQTWLAEKSWLKIWWKNLVKIGSNVWCVSSARNIIHQNHPYIMETPRFWIFGWFWWMIYICIFGWFWISSIIIFGWMFCQILPRWFCPPWSPLKGQASTLQLCRVQPATRAAGVAEGPHAIPDPADRKWFIRPNLLHIFAIDMCIYMYICIIYR